MRDRTTMYVIDKDYRIIYRNPAFREMYPDIECGAVCHKALGDLDVVCDHCPRKNENDRNTFYNIATGQWIKAQMAHIEWEGNPDCYAVFCNVWDEPKEISEGDIPKKTGKISEGNVPKEMGKISEGDVSRETEKISEGDVSRETEKISEGDVPKKAARRKNGTLLSRFSLEKDREIKELMEANIRMSSDMHRIQKELEANNRELLSNNQMLSFISDEMPGGYHQCYEDEGFTFRYISNQMLKILGFTRKEMEERFNNKYAGLVHPDDIAQMKAGFYGKNGDGNAYEFHYRIMTSKGYIWVKDVTVKCEFDGDVFYQGVIMDITEEMKVQNQLIRRNNEMEVILSNIPGGMKVSRMDETYSFSYVSNEALALFGCTMEEFMELSKGSASGLVYEPDRKSALSYVTQMLEKDGTYSVKYRVMCADGSIKYIMDCGKRYEGDGGELYVSSLYLDVTKESETEQMVELQRQLLDRELELKFQQDENIQRERKANAALEDALRQAENANRAKTAFLNNMSHDIRTPMNAIVGFTELASKHIDDSGRVSDYLSKITSSSNHLLSLINDVLDMSRIESGKMSFDEKPEDIRSMLSDIFNIIQPGMRDKGIAFEVDVDRITDTRVLCDKLRFNQVMLNLLSNAVKYTDPEGRIMVVVKQVFCARENHVSFEIHVGDTGIGMSHEFVKHIFEPFARERSSTVSGIQGTGLGMSITKNIVDLMGGTISVASEEGKGTEFIVNLTMEKCGDAREPVLADNAETNVLIGMAGDVGLGRESAQKVEFAGKKLLLVDDNELNREIAQEVLTDYGFNVVTAVDGLYAVDIVAKSEPGDIYAVIMDIQMPLMNGYEATRKIRGLEDGRLANIPIIAMTANAFEEDRKMAMEVKMDGYVPKPVHVPSLIESLKRLEVKETGVNKC